MIESYSKMFLLQNLEQNKTRPPLQCEDLSLPDTSMVRKDSEANILEDKFSECDCSNSDFQRYFSFSALQPKVNCTSNAF